MAEDMEKKMSNFQHRMLNVEGMYLLPYSELGVENSILEICFFFHRFISLPNSLLH